MINENIRNIAIIAHVDLKIQMNIFSIFMYL